MDEAVGPWTWDEADPDEDLPCTQSADTGLRDPVSGDDLAALGVCGSREWRGVDYATAKPGP
jgi:hypothetical protein